MKRYGRPEVIVTDRLRSYGAAMKDMGVEDLQLCGQGTGQIRSPRAGRCTRSRISRAALSRWRRAAPLARTRRRGNPKRNAGAYDGLHGGAARRQLRGQPDAATMGGEVPLELGAGPLR